MNDLETVNQAEINMSSKMGESLFKLGRYNRVFLDIWAQMPIWAPILKRWAVGSFFSRKYSRRAHRDPQKFFFFIKTSKWEKWWSLWLRMTNAFILYVIYCEKFRKVLQRIENVALICSYNLHLGIMIQISEWGWIPKRWFNTKFTPHILVLHIKDKK